MPFTLLLLPVFAVQVFVQPFEARLGMNFTPDVLQACGRMLLVDGYFSVLAKAYGAAPWLSRAGPDVQLARLFAFLHHAAARRQRRRIAEKLGACLSKDPKSTAVAAAARQAIVHRWVKSEPNSLLALTANKETRRHLCAAVEVVNRRRIHKALEDGRGAILWGCPFGQPLLARAVLHDLGLPLIQLHEVGRVEPPDWLRRLPMRCCYRAAEESLVTAIVDVERQSLAYLKEVRERLSQNRLVLINAMGRNGQAFVDCDFLGARRPFATGGVSLARAAGAPILPVFCFEDETRRVRLVIETPIVIDRSDDRQAAAARALQNYAGLLEGYILRYPAQWPRWHAGPQPLSARTG